MTMPMIRYSTQFVQGETLGGVHAHGRDWIFCFIRKPVRETVCATVSVDDGKGTYILRSRPDGTCLLWDAVISGPQLIAATMNDSGLLALAFDSNPKSVTVVADYEYDADDPSNNK